MINTSKKLAQLIEEGHVIVIIDSVTLLTDEATPMNCPAVDITVFHKDLDIPRHDSKPFRDAVGVGSISEAQTIADERLKIVAADIILPAVMEFLTPI